MFRSFKRALPAERIETIEQAVKEAVAAGDMHNAGVELKPLLRAARHQADAARALLRIVASHELPIEMALDLLVVIRRAHPDDLELLALVGAATEAARDIDLLNAPPPDHPLFLEIVDSLADRLDEVRGTEQEEDVLAGLATAARMVGRQRDTLAEQSYLRLIELDPERSSHHYNYGLFMKTRGRFAEGVDANQAAARLAGSPVDSYDWNLGICATGAGQGEVALAVWKGIGNKIEMGRFDLPEGGYPECKVRLAERPLAERDAESDDPGLEETIWIQRLSPCHGIVRSVLVQDLGVDYGDVVLTDGAPITYHRYGNIEVPVFPHLATLRRQNYRYYDFAGTQTDSGQLESLSRGLSADAIIYSHTESYSEICASCWRDPDIDHKQHDVERRHVVTGRIAAPPSINAQKLLEELDAALERDQGCRLYAPSLSIVAGETERVSVDQRRFDMLTSS